MALALQFLHAIHELLDLLFRQCAAVNRFTTCDAFHIMAADLRPLLAVERLTQLIKLFVKWL